MKQKIEWYREVLELEPGSRVFFPLAKLLAANGQTADAVNTLRQGLLRHPDHVEARLLLVELLYLQGDDQGLAAEISSLGGTFALYPVFWQAWSEKLSRAPSFQDASLALRFFAAALQGRTINWADVVTQGLNIVLKEVESSPSLLPQGPAIFQEAMSADVAAEPSPLPGTPEPETAPATEDAPETSEADGLDFASEPDGLSGPDGAPEPDVTIEPDFAPEALDIPEADDAPGPEEGDAVRLPDDARPDASTPAGEAPGPDQDPEEDDGASEEEEEAFSLRTRSMAEVLAEQGDVAGALDIYRELAANASEAELAGLEKRMEELSIRLHSPPSHELNAPDKPAQPGSESARLVTLLESLAQRLEDRAR